MSIIIELCLRCLSRMIRCLFSWGKFLKQCDSSGIFLQTCFGFDSLRYHDISFLRIMSQHIMRLENVESRRVCETNSNSNYYHDTETFPTTIMTISTTKLLISATILKVNVALKRLMFQLNRVATRERIKYENRRRITSFRFQYYLSEE